MIGIITRKHNDIMKLLEQNEVKYQWIKEIENLENYDVLLILGGTEEKPLSFKMKEYLQLESFMNSGKKIFAEYVSSFGPYLLSETVLTKNKRIAYLGLDSSNLNTFDIISTQSTFHTTNFNYEVTKENILYIFTQAHAHESLESEPENIKLSDYAIFMLRENVMLSNVQVSNYNQNRFAPMSKTNRMIQSILEWLDIKTKDNFLKSPYSLMNNEDSKKTVKKAIEWFEKNQLLVDEGKSGVLEGFGSEIFTDGTQRLSETLRADCIGETAGLFHLASIYFQDSTYREIATNLFSSLRPFVIEDGPYKGFVRWSNIALESNYGDDVARMMIPLIFKNLIEDSNVDDIELIKNVCDFHVSTTGVKGLREGRMEYFDLNDNFISQRKNDEFVTPSAHYNAYYHAMLLLGYQLTKEEKYKTVGLNGLDSLMSIYPETQREQSQTQEESRLILPLALAYHISNDNKYKRYLDTVYDDLKKRHHPLGGYVEWDTGYKAVMRHTKGDGECSLLSKNGDVVCDLLYTNNWLPIAFTVAYSVTGDAKYEEAAKSIVDFMKRIQIKSENRNINGAWMRAFALELDEYYGSPADQGWGPFCIESGWTVAQITSGIILYELRDNLMQFFGGKYEI